MTSSTGSEVFVHARLPDGATAVVGRYRFRRDRGDRNLGEFRYAGSWARNEHGRAFPLDPVNLPLSAQTVLHHQARRSLRRARGHDARSLGPAAAPAHPPRSAMSPARSAAVRPATSGSAAWHSRRPRSRRRRRAGSCRSARGRRSRTLSIASCAAQDADPKLIALYRAGQSLGGVRPKAVVEHDGQLWIAKFARHDDEIDECAAEHATMRLAARCGIRRRAKPS